MDGEYSSANIRDLYQWIGPSTRRAILGRHEHRATRGMNYHIVECRASDFSNWATRIVYARIFEHHQGHDQLATLQKAISRVCDRFSPQSLWACSRCVCDAGLPPRRTRTGGAEIRFQKIHVEELLRQFHPLERATPRTLATASNGRSSNRQIRPQPGPQRGRRKELSTGSKNDFDDATTATFRFE